MPVTAPSPTVAPDAGMQARFIAATLTCLAEHGHHGTTVRRIAKEAGVAPGLLTHYFAGKDALIAQAYAQLADEVLARLGSAVERAGTDPVARLRAFISTSFGASDMGPDLLRVWVHFWAMALTDTDVAAAHRDTDATYRTYLAGLLLPLVGDQHEAALLARALAAMLDGMWLAWGLDPDGFDSDAQTALALDMAARMLGNPAVSS
ncbi:MAG: TetR family transcriptional regulator C-terminal domain-containing protein [Pseudomonadota bacterium]